MRWVSSLQLRALGRDDALQVGRDGSRLWPDLISLLCKCREMVGDDGLEPPTSSV